jgi:hypothetical protein
MAARSATLGGAKQQAAGGHVQADPDVHAVDAAAALRTKAARMTTMVSRHRWLGLALWAMLAIAAATLYLP